MNEVEKTAVYTIGARFVLFQTSQFEAEIDGALICDDIEYVHRMRVASRRLRNALEVFEEYFPENCAKKWRNEMKGITKALGNARDLDIQIQLIEEKVQEMLDQVYKPGYERLLLRLRQARAKAQEKVVNAIHSLKNNQTIEEIKDQLIVPPIEQEQHFSPALYAFAQDAINQGLDSFLSYQEFIHTPNNSEKLHAMRINGKHFRYTMEIFAPLYQEKVNPFVEIMKGIQDRLGEIHDCDVWIAWLPDFLRLEQGRTQVYFGRSRSLARFLPGIQHLIEDRKQCRQAEYQAFIADWHRLISDHTWEKLRVTIQNPETL
jgi:CHAD domain-containing protein